MKNSDKRFHFEGMEVDELARTTGLLKSREKCTKSRTAHGSEALFTV